ncbi:MAG: tail fiber protein [Cohaesibacteraceae bacterium]|nr:tail fiber protein [Cohaesibacteraceae bacterium]MBL4876260.1 tail fiber protein [Cohaesibacteraceae bacterium]
MTVSNNVNRFSSIGDGSTTVFSHPNMRIDEVTDLVVYFVVDDQETLQISGYTVSGLADDAGGAVTFSSAPAVGVRIVRIRQPALMQLTSLPTVGGGPASMGQIERGLDKLTHLLQSVSQTVVRSLNLRPSDIEGQGTYDANGNRITNVAPPLADGDLVTKIHLESYCGDAVSAGQLALSSASSAGVSATQAEGYRDETQILRDEAVGAQPIDITTFGRDLVDEANAADARAKLGAISLADIPPAAAGIPVGTILAFAGSTPPTGFLRCDGNVFDAGTYPELNTVLGGTTLPDLRGEFLRGLDDGRGVDSGRSLLSAQGQAAQSHNHTVSDAYVSGVSTWNQWVPYSGSGVKPVTAVNTATTTRTTSSSGGSETRPRNIAVLYIIRAST